VSEVGDLEFTKGVAASFSSSSILFRLPGLTYHRRMLLRYLMAEVTVAAATEEAVVGRRFLLAHSCISCFRDQASIGTWPF
jgi:hypothetical protein